MSQGRKSIFDIFYNEEKSLLPPEVPYDVVWAHHDGRCLAMTGVSQHRLPAIPKDFIKDKIPLDNNVEIWVKSAK